jgi:cytochrome P450
MKPPVFEIDPKSFWQNPYPALAEMRKTSPICFVPQLNATLFTKRDDIFTCEKMVDVFSSDQPGGLMTVLMGENMMRKDGEQHLLERKQTFPALSPRTVRDLWKAKFQHHTAEIIASFRERPTFQPTHCATSQD